MVSRNAPSGKAVSSVASSSTRDISRFVAGGDVANLLKTEGESSAELDGSSLPLLVVEGRI